MWLKIKILIVIFSHTSYLSWIMWLLYYFSPVLLPELLQQLQPPPQSDPRDAGQHGRRQLARSAGAVQKHIILIALQSGPPSPRSRSRSPYSRSGQNSQSESVHIGEQLESSGADKWGFQYQFAFRCAQEVSFFMLLMMIIFLNELNYLFFLVQ